LMKALFLAPDAAAVHLCLGLVQTHTNRAAQGVRTFERALELDRNLAGGHGQLGLGKIHLGQPQQTEAHIQEAMRLSPRDTYVYVWCLFAGLAKFHLGEEENAVYWLRRSVEANRIFPNSHFILAAALARLGRHSEAQSEAQAGLAIFPAFSISRYRAVTQSDNSAVLAGRERIVDGLRKAGLPE
jgi:tetratricopeptide (TPR) repeat protein